MRADLDTVERLFEGARRGKMWSRASYPLGCTPRRGRVRFSVAPDDSLVVRVECRPFDGADHQLRVLFATGVAVFATPQELFEFAKGPLADAFGMPRERRRARRRSEPAFDVEPGDARRMPSANDLVDALSRIVTGQTAALERVAHVVCAQRAKTTPSRPGSVMLLGPTGTGKTSTVEALPAALESLGEAEAHVYRVDCNELTQPFQVSRLIGSPPGYVGYGDASGLLRALEQPGCILLLDEVDKAHPSVLEQVLLNLIDNGRLSGPKGQTIHAEHAVIAMTSNLGADELDVRLHRIPLENRWAVQRVCREILREEGVPDELLGRIGVFAVYEPLAADALREAAVIAVGQLAREYGLRVPKVDPVIVDVILDIAADSGLGARALTHAAGELLAEAFAAAAGEGVRGTVAVKPGPPVRVTRRTRRAA